MHYLQPFYFYVTHFIMKVSVWILGRASSMANAFGILGLVILTELAEGKNKNISFLSLFFAGLTSYESIMILPVMVLVILYEGNRAGIAITWTFAMTVTFILHSLRA